MSGRKSTHDKQLARARDKRQADRLQSKQQRSRVLVIAVVVLIVVALVGGTVLSTIGSGDDAPGTADDTAAEPATDAADDAADDDAAADEGAAAADLEPCPSADDAPEPAAEVYDEAPSADLDEAAAYTVTVATTCGDIVFDLDVAGAPATAATFVALAEDGYYTGTPFHRLARDFVIQGGDPAGTGCGQEDCLAFDPEAATFPGFTIEDELATAEAFEPDPDQPGAVTYPRGTVAMANGGPDTVGSQFFVVQADPGYPFLPAYTVLGTVTEGLDVVDRIAAGEVQGDQAVDPTIVTEVTVATS